MTRILSTATKRHAAALAVFVALMCSLMGLAAPAASAQSAGDEAAMFTATNQSRAANGLPALQYDAALSSIANAWADRLAGAGSLSHNPGLVDQINSQVTGEWTRIGENVGFGPNVAALEQAFMNSAPHRGNILGDYNRVGVGATRDSRGTLWVVVDFVKGPAIASAAPASAAAAPAVHAVSWFLRNSASGGPADSSFAYGASNYQFVTGDWNGDGADSIGVYVDGGWYLRNSTSGGSPDISFAFGAAGYVPVVGDWNGDGIDTIGVFTNGWWYLRNSNTPGPPDIVVNYGGPGMMPVVGDWNGDGIDTVGVFTSGWWYLRNSNSGGTPDAAINYGAADYTPVVGAWSGGAADGIGVYVNGWWYLRNTPSAGPANIVVNFGAAGYQPVVGRWTSGPSGIGVVATG